MKLDPTLIRYIEKDTFRVLTAVEMGMKNHEYVPTELICSIAGLKGGGAYKHLNVLHKHKLVHHSSQKYDGYTLTYLGYDFLALRALAARGVISGVGRQIGVGKESDIFLVQNSEGKEMVLKLHRLGRVSFRTIKKNRDYLKNRKSASWLYMSRLAALKEYAYMKVLYDNGFRVPVPYDHNRHCVVMEIIDGYPLCQVREVGHPASVYSDCMNMIVRLAQYGLIHGDFNEFNLLITEQEEVVMIDFPQMVSTSHYNADMYFNRDVECIRTFFEKRFNFVGEDYPKLDVDGIRLHSLDVEAHVSGFNETESEVLDGAFTSNFREEGDGGSESDSEVGSEESSEGFESGGADSEGVDSDEGGPADAGEDDESGKGGKKVRFVELMVERESDSDGEGEGATGDAPLLIPAAELGLTVGNDSGDEGAEDEESGEGEGEGESYSSEPEVHLRKRDYIRLGIAREADGGSSGGGGSEGGEGGEGEGEDDDTQSTVSTRKVRRKVDFRKGGAVGARERRRLAAKRQRTQKRNVNKGKTLREDKAAVKHYNKNDYYG